MKASVKVQSIGLIKSQITMNCIFPIKLFGFPIKSRCDDALCDVSDL